MSNGHKKTCLLLAITLFVLFLSPLVMADHYHPAPGGEGSNPGDEPGIIARMWNWLMNAIFGGDPVYLKDGEYVLSVTDLSVRGRSLPVKIARTYASRSEYNSRFGYGWDMNYNLKVRKLHDPNTIVLLNGQNYRVEYTFDPNSDPNAPEYTPPAGLYDYLVENANGTYTIAKKHGTQLEFDINGNLASITDRLGSSITFEYDANGLMPLNGPSEYFVGQSYGLVASEYRLKTITDDLGRKINFTYNSDGLLTGVTDFAGRSWTYGYDAATNDLLTVTGPATAEYPSGLTTTYTYDPNHRLLTATDPNNQTYLTNTYDDQARVSSQDYGDGTYTFSYNPDANEVTVTDREGFEQKAVYNDLGQAVSQTVYTDGLRAGDPNSYITRYEYNSSNEVAKVIYPAGNWVDYTYDTSGNLLTACSEPNNGEPNILTVYTYESNFNFVKTKTDPKGNVTTFTYDYEDANSYSTDVGNLMKITYPTAGGQTPVVSFTYYNDANDVRFGKAETVTAPDGIATKYEYYTDVNDSANYGKVHKVIADYNDTAGLNITTEYKYDTIGRVIEVKDPNTNVTKFTYNNLDQLTKVEAPSPFNYITNLSYDKCKKLAQIERERTGDNQITNYAYDTLDNLKKITDPLSYVTTLTYDNSENLSAVTDANGIQTQYDYDERDLLWKVTDANSEVTEYSYTKNGRLAKIKDAHDNETTYTYDGFDRLICVTYPDDTNEAFAYDKNSNLTSYKNRSDETTSYQYDALNRLTVKTRPGEPNITILYDIASRVYDVNDGRSVSNGGGLTSYYYDSIGRVTDVNDIEGRLVSYEYDERGLRTELVWPDDSFITYEYDKLGRLTKIKDDSSNVLAEYSYDELSRRTQLTLGNDATAVYTYDLGNRLTSLDNNFADTNSTTLTFDYTHDKLANRLTMTVDDSDQHSYSYDVLYQLTDVDYPEVNDVSYYYDALGNRISVDDGSSTSYSSNNLNQYTSVGGAGYSYDNRGNLTDDATYDYYYDCENRLTDVNDAGQIASYKYDYLGRRVAKIVDGNTIEFCYDGAQVIAEYENDVLVRKFIYGPGIDEPICMITSTATYYYHFDGLGSAVALSDANSEIVEAYTYDVYGEPNSTSAVGNPYLFTGRRYDSETSLYYYRARYYNAVIGRFLQTDPVGYYDSLNLYTYCGNDPLNWVDPWGLCKGKGQDRPDMLDVWWNETMRYFWATEYAVSAATDALLEPLSWASEFPDFTIPYGATLPLTRGAYANPEIYVPTKFIGTAAAAADKAVGDWVESHKEEAKWSMIYYHEKMQAQRKRIREAAKKNAKDPADYMGGPMWEKYYLGNPKPGRERR